jgi:hypothetical protein
MISKDDRDLTIHKELTEFAFELISYGFEVVIPDCDLVLWLNFFKNGRSGQVYKSLGGYAYSTIYIPNNIEGTGMSVFDCHKLHIDLVHSVINGKQSYGNVELYRNADHYIEYNKTRYNAKNKKMMNNQ